MDCAISSAPPLLAGVAMTAPPMLGTAAPARTPRAPSKIRPIYVILAMFLLTPLICVLGIASFFHLSSPTQALRRSVMAGAPGDWNNRFAINVGPLTLDAARFVTSFIKLPPEAEAALQGVRGAEVGVYRLGHSPRTVNYSAILGAADKAMSGRGWERIVGVAQDGQFVAVYAPHGLRSLKRISCCVAVLDKQDLVVVSAHGNLEPLMELPKFREAQRNLTRLFGDEKS